MKKKAKKNNIIESIILSIVFTLFIVYFLWTIFLLTDHLPFLDSEFRVNLALGLVIILMIGLLIIYLLKEKKFMKRFNINATAFNITLVPTWVISHFYLTAFTHYLIREAVIHICTSTKVDLIYGRCYLNGIEYTLFGYIALILIVIFFIIKLVQLFIKIQKG